jgi:hypothetical protein
MEHDYPLLHEPRPWATIRVGATSDARWRNVHPRVFQANMLRVHEVQQRARRAQPVKATREGPKE